MHSLSSQLSVLKKHSIRPRATKELNLAKKTRGPRLNFNLKPSFSLKTSKLLPVRPISYRSNSLIGVSILLNKSMSHRNLHKDDTNKSQTKLNDSFPCFNNTSQALEGHTSLLKMHFNSYFCRIQTLSLMLNFDIGVFASTLFWLWSRQGFAFQLRPGLRPEES